MEEAELFFSSGVDSVSVLEFLQSLQGLLDVLGAYVEVYSFSDNFGDWSVFLEFLDLVFGETYCNTRRHTSCMTEPMLIIIVSGGRE